MGQSQNIFLHELTIDFIVLAENAIDCKEGL